MKFNKYIIAIAIFGLSYTTFGQVKYRRSNLTMVLIEDNNLGKEKDMVINAYNANPFPDKYNQHDISDKNFSTEKIKLTNQDYIKAGFYKDTLKTPMDFLKAKKKPFNKVRFLKADSTIGILEPTDEELTNIYVYKYITDKKIAKQVVSSWYNETIGKSYPVDIEKVRERAAYSADAKDLKDFKTSQQLIDKVMKDTSIIRNSFVVFNKMKFYENEPVARLIRDAALAEANTQLAGKPEIIVKKALESINKLYDLTKEGYTVQCNTYLYQLDWSKDVVSKTKQYFFNSEMKDKSNAFWDTTNIYKLNFVGKTVTGSIVVGGKKSLQEIIDLQVKRTMDNAMAKLQKENIVFRPVSPINTFGPITAKLGLKEGVEPGQQYELIQPEYEDDILLGYKRVGKIKVSKKSPIWDNRVGAEPTKDIEGKLVNVTTFKGGKKINSENVGVTYLRLIK